MSMKPATTRGSYRSHLNKKNPQKALPPLQIQDRDVEILFAVSENRFLTRPMLSRLFPPNQTARTFKSENPHDITHSNLQKRLRALFWHDYLHRFKIEIGGEFIYTLDTKGARLLSSLDAPTMAREMKRTRVFIREKGTSSPIDPDDFMEHLRKKLTQIEDLYSSFMVGSEDTSRYAHLYRPQLQEVRQMLAMLDDPTTTQEAVKERILPYKAKTWIGTQVDVTPDRAHIQQLKWETTEEEWRLFPSYDFKTTTYPDVNDFVNMEEYHAFIRKQKAENVTYFKTHAPPPPVAGIKGQILHNMRELHAARQQPQPQPLPKKSKVVQLRPQAQEKPAGLAEGVTVTKNVNLQNQKRKPQKQKLTF